VLAKDTALAQSCGDRSHFACLFSEAHADVYSFRRSSIAIMNNRLGDISGWAHDDESTNGDIELGTQQQNASSQPKHMEHFFREVDAIKKDIDAVKKATKAIGDINEAALQATTTEEENTLSQRLRPVVDQTNKRAKRTKNMLGLLKEENQKLKGDGDVKPSDLRIRENLCNTLTRKFIDEMKAYQASQQKYKTDIKKKVTRQVQIVKPDATEEEVDAVMRSEGGRDALYRERILAGGVNDQINTTYKKVAGKYQDVLALEQSVAELHQMFLDFALLTEQQGELLDQIEFQVKQAADYVEDANVDVYESIEHQKSIRKKQCWIILIVIIATVVILFAIGVLP
jgi:t-SNARE complex subunit (syntaxin)